MIKYRRKLILTLGIFTSAFVFFASYSLINNDLFNSDHYIKETLKNKDDNLIKKEQDHAPNVLKDQTSKENQGEKLVATKPQEREVRAIYLTAQTAASAQRMTEIIKIVEATPLNAVVIDIKDFSGRVYFDTKVDLANDLGITKDILSNIEDLITQLHEKDIYVIARQTVFQDPALAEAKPEWAVKDSSGGLWRDWKGLTWVDTTLPEVWDYNIAIAKDAVNLGFDEINFDYIRFPSDGPISRMRFANWDGSFKKHEIVAAFFAKLYEELKDKPVYLSADLFGLTTIRNDDMNIGQLIEDAAPFFDYIMPMMYPSHYPSGFYGFTNPAVYPYEIIKPGVEKAVARLSKVPNNRAKLRPWIQDFDIGAVYDRSKVQAQIQAIIDGGGFGYAAWNARNVYNPNDYK